MKIRNKNLICLIGVFLFLITPFFSFVSFANAQSTENSLIVGATSSDPQNWDPAISQADLMGAIKGSAMEALVWVDSFGNLHPLLAESWTIHNRSDEISSLGENQGGVAAIEFKLREGVTFQDGSAFNASVVKWNYDRALQISGYDDPQWMANYWMDPASYRSRFTPNWDLTWGINDPDVSFIDTAAYASIPDGGYITYTAKTTTGVQDYYIYFDTTGTNSTDPAPSGRMPIYCDISASTVQKNVSDVLSAAIGAVSGISATNTDDNVTITNALDGDVTDIADVDSGLTVSTVSQGIMRNPYASKGGAEYIPIINETIAVSEYVVNFTLNKWYSRVAVVGALAQISQVAYGSWHNKSIAGYETVPNAYDGTVFPGHMIGTGAYEFESVDFVVEAKAHATKNMNYWNRTALEAVDLFSVTDLYIRFFADPTSRGNALLATDVDLVNSMLQDPAPIADVKASSYLTYYPTVPDASVNVVSMLSAEAINKPLASLGGLTIREWFPTSSFCTDTLGLPSGTQYPNGVPKTVRKALSYAYDYNGFIAATYPDTSGGGIYCWSPFGMSSPFTDDSVDHPGPAPDLLAARAILLADPNFAAPLAARGLDITNSTAEWEAVAANNPIDSFSFLIYPASTTTAFLREACEGLGFELDVKEHAAEAGFLWTKFVQTGRAAMYDMFSYVFLMNPNDPAQYANYWYSSGAAKPPGWAYNYGHTMNATVDAIIANVEFLTDKQASYNELADILINQEAAALYESQGTMGMVLNAGFTLGPLAQHVGGPAGPGMRISWLGGSRIQASALPPEIPGFSTLFVLLAMIPSIIGLIYVIKRKRK